MGVDGFGTMLQRGGSVLFSVPALVVISINQVCYLFLGRILVVKVLLLICHECPSF